MIPVMLFGVLFAKKRYSVRDYMCVGLITAGIVTFNLAKASHATQKVCPYAERTAAVYILCMICFFRFTAIADPD